MRKLGIVCAGLFLGGCGANVTSTHVKSETQLGRVVIYRNGVAYFERYADVSGDTLKVAVPSDKVDDFLKSLTVVDAQTGKPAPIAYPSGPSGGTIDMKIHLDGTGPHKVRLSYVTDAPSWKPTYRAIVSPGGKVDLQAWAIVDNTSGEDWDRVKLGVGSSSAMAFRFDLKSLRLVERETLKSDTLFATAPPLGGVTHGQGGHAGQAAARVMTELSDEAIARNEVVTGKKTAGNASFADVRQTSAPPPPMSKAPQQPSPGARGVGVGGGGNAGPMSVTRPAQEPALPAEEAQARAQLDGLVRQAQSTKNTIVIEGYASGKDGDKMTSSLERANRVRDQLLRNGVDPNRVVAVGRGDGGSANGGVRVVEQPLAQAPPAKPAQPAAPESGDPVGTSHFESGTAMTVPRGTSAMISILSGKTDGQVVYLYDPETARGNAQFPFKSLRFTNPTDSVLESGPVSVFGDGRFIGEGLAEPIPGRAAAFVPFALDRQILVEKKTDEKDAIARILTVQRGVFSTEVQHKKVTTFTVHSRLGEPSTVYVRHTVPAGYTLGASPPHAEKIGQAVLFRLDLKANEKRDIVIEEHTPVFKTTDIRTPHGLEQIKAYVSQGAAKAGLQEKLSEIVKLNQDLAKIEEHIATLREQQAEYRTRMDELHMQIVTLKAVKSAGPLMTNLEKKLAEISDKVSKAAIDVVAQEEKRMVARVRLQDAVAELSLEKDRKKDPEAPPAKP